MTESSDLVELKVEGLALDREQTPVVVLREVSGARTVPIWIGQAEAHAIGIVLEGKTAPRPLSADLLRNILDELRVSVVRLIIADARENTYYGRLFIQPENAPEKEIDCRPSDGIAIALRTNAPILMPATLIERIERERGERDEREAAEKGRVVVDTGETTVH